MTFPIYKQKGKRQILEIIGEVKEIVYHNEMNSYTVAVLETDKEETIIVGYLPFVNIGDTLKLYGDFVEHIEYGVQFKVSTFEKIMPRTLEALERYLGNGLIKGIGPAIARNIVQAFGEETIHIFKFEPEKLSKVKGITKERAIEIANSFVENWELWQIVGFLEKFGLGPQSAQTVYKRLGNNAIEEIETNPYILLDIINNIDFKQIDSLAIKNGIEKNNYKRVRSGIKYAFLRATTNGHSCVNKENLMQYVSDLLEITYDDVHETMITMKAKEEIKEEKRKEINWIYLANYYRIEQNIADRLMNLVNASNVKKIHNIDKKLKNIEKESIIDLSEKQKEAILAINNNNVCVITGGPGTGKTTIIKTIIELYKKEEKKVVLCAPTGRAAKRMTEATGEEAKTLHRLLEIQKTIDDEYAEEINVSPIDGDVVIVDEVSMVDMFLMNNLIKALYKGTKLVLVGDVDQLPSVGPGSVLKDIINSNRIEVIVLNKIFRQAAKSKIILNSHKVNEGESFIGVKYEDKEIKDDFFFIPETNQEKILSNVISLCTGRLKKYANYDFFENIQIITPTKKGKLGTKELNVILQEKLNPETDFSKEKRIGKTIFRTGDRVMQIKNNYDIYWEKKGEKFESGSGVFNGEMGKIESFNEETKTVKIKFDDDKYAWYAYNEMDQIEHSYSITIHKAQGSEFDVVIMPITQSAPMLLTRNLLYTGMTRAKKMLIIVGNPNIINFMINNIDGKKRNTGLQYKLEKEL